MTFSNQEAKQWMEWLSDEGYPRWVQALTANEDFGFFKSFRDENDEVLYEIEYRFWDWNKYPKSDGGYGIDVIIITCAEHRADMEIGCPRNIDDTERIAKEFYEFCKERELI